MSVLLLLPTQNLLNWKWCCFCAQSLGLRTIGKETVALRD